MQRHAKYNATLLVKRSLGGVGVAHRNCTFICKELSPAFSIDQGGCKGDHVTRDRWVDGSQQQGWKFTANQTINQLATYIILWAIQYVLVRGVQYTLYRLYNTF